MQFAENNLHITQTSRKDHLYFKLGLESNLTIFGVE